MNVNRIIPVHHDNPVGAVHDFLAAWWQSIGLQALLAPIEAVDRSGVVTQPIEQLRDIERINPFAPLMLSNAAALVNAFVRDRAGQRLAVMLRPCELRALIELRKRHRVGAVDEALANHTLVVIGVDCVATYPPDEYARRLREHGDEAVTHDALMYAGEGVYSPYDLRPACKVCDWPAPRGADVVIGAIGVAAEQYLLVIAHDEETDERWRLGQSDGGPGDRESGGAARNGRGRTHRQTRGDAGAAAGLGVREHHGLCAVAQLDFQLYIVRRLPGRLPHVQR